ncbi:rubrerythrin-like domain-containing protein [Halorientalis pallida]|uniref:Rubrerythrin-like domain-containing protein n=1 Tax=Halorientalis pallida TaxID=2479928 RepID=A0A498KU95_9EURY|nr:rubrerythrin-like domain-containing protein [Halorientalis pallida]RXK48542.1 rubrerythrin-like domain-containing protein [Halorientalis pallida]
MPSGDPYSPVRPFVYECVSCRLRVQADSQPETCPECGCVMCDLSVPRE